MRQMFPNYKIIYSLKKNKTLLFYFVPGSWYKKMNMLFVRQEFTLNQSRPVNNYYYNAMLNTVDKYQRQMIKYNHIKQHQGTTELREKNSSTMGQVVPHREQGIQVTQVHTLSWRTQQDVKSLTCTPGFISSCVQQHGLVVIFMGKPHI